MKCIQCDVNGINKSLSYGVQTIIIPTIVQRYDEGIRGQLTSTEITSSHTANEPSIHKLIHIDDKHNIHKVIIREDDHTALMAQPSIVL